MSFKLSLDKKATYRIKVPGEIRKLHMRIGEIQINYQQSQINDEGISVIIGTFDQAGLYGFLRRIYAMGVPLIEVVCLDFPHRSS